MTRQGGYGRGRHLDINSANNRKGFAMPKEEWGTKRLCPKTGKRFYDLNKSPIVSPYTGEAISLDTGNKTRVAVAEKVKEPVEKETESTDDTDEVLEEDDADVDLEDDLLEDDDDDDTVPLDEIADVASEKDDS